MSRKGKSIERKTTGNRPGIILPLYALSTAAESIFPRTGRPLTRKYCMLRLLRVIEHNEGGANKDLARFADQINALCDKWDR